MRTDLPQPPPEESQSVKWRIAQQLVLENLPERTFYIARVSDGSHDIYMVGTEGHTSFSEAEMDSLSQRLQDSRTKFSQLSVEEQQGKNDAFDSLINRINIPDPKQPVTMADFVWGIRRAVGEEYEELFRQKQLKLQFTQRQAGQSHPQTQ